MYLEYETEKSIDELILEGYNQLYPINNYNLVTNNVFRYFDKDSMIDQVYICSGFIYSKFMMSMDQLKPIFNLISIKSITILSRKIRSDEFIIQSSDEKYWSKCISDEQKFDYTRYLLELNTKYDSAHIKNEDLLKIIANYIKSKNRYVEFEYSKGMLGLTVVYEEFNGNIHSMDVCAFYEGDELILTSKLTEMKILDVIKLYPYINDINN